MQHEVRRSFLSSLPQRPIVNCSCSPTVLLNLISVASDAPCNTLPNNWPSNFAAWPCWDVTLWVPEIQNAFTGIVSRTIHSNGIWRIWSWSLAGLEQATQHIRAYFLLYNTSVLIATVANGNQSSSQNGHQLRVTEENKWQVAHLFSNSSVFCSTTHRNWKGHGYTNNYLPCEVWWDSFPTGEQLGSQHGTKKSSQEVAATLEEANQPKKKIAQILKPENRGANKRCSCKKKKTNHFRRKVQTIVKHEIQV